MNSILNLVRMTPRKAERKRGVTLIEAVLFISIALGLIVGGIVFFQQASLAQRVQGAVRTISSIASETRALFQAQTDFTGATTATLIASGAVPSNIINGNALRNEWGGAITIAPTAADGNATGVTNFTVTYTQVPAAACVRLSSYDNSGAGVVGSSIAQIAWKVGNGTSNSAPTGVSQGAGDGVTPAEATIACTGIMTIAYTFGR